MCHRHELHQPLLAGRGQRLQVAVEHGLERLLGLPAGVLRRQRLDAIEDEGELDIHRLLDPQRPVIVECGDALIRRHEVRSALRGDPRDELVIDCFVAPSFQDGSGSPEACAEAGIERSGPRRTGNAAKVETSRRRLRLPSAW